MSERYKILDNSKAYFLTFTIIDWIELFKEKHLTDIVINSLIYCQNQKGLQIFGWCIMPSHIHLIARADGKTNLSDITRDFKKYTARRIIKYMEEKNHEMMEPFSRYRQLKRIKGYKIWQDGSQPKEINSPKFYYQKLDYIHMNPVKAGLAENPWEYPYSSARNYAEMESPIGVVLESQGLKYLVQKR